MKVILVSGPGRIHFIETATALARNGVDFRFICGLKPSWFWRLPCIMAQRLFGRDRLYGRLMIRLGPDQILKKQVEDFWWPELVEFVIRRLASVRQVYFDKALAVTWKYYGRCLRNRLHDADILHVRSGAGQGGAITEARRRGMRIIVDHSIAHPVEMGNVLTPHYARFGKQNPMREDSPFWRQVLADCEQADVLLVNSDYVKDTFVQRGVCGERIRVLYLGVRDDFLGAKQQHREGGRLKLLFTGTLAIRKGAHILLEAMDELRKRNIDFELHVAGEVTEAQEFLSDQMACLPLVLHGYISQDELLNLFQQCDLYVFPTLVEGCAKSAMEAMLAGVPVITTTACGLPGEAGCHWIEIPRGDANALADKIVEAWLERSLRTRIGTNGIALGQSGDFSWDHYGKQLKSLYMQSLEVEK